MARSGDDQGIPFKDQEWHMGGTPVCRYIWEGRDWALNNKGRTWHDWFFVVDEISKLIDVFEDHQFN